MTAVLVKRADAAPARRRRSSAASTSIPALVAFTADAFARLAIDARLLPTVDLAVEELFTNMVKYGTGSDAPVQRRRCAAIDGGVEVTLIDHDVEPFDVTRAPDVDIDAPIEEREPGGLGLHLIRRMADSRRVRVYAGDPAKPDHAAHYRRGRGGSPQGREHREGRMLGD